MHIHTLSHTQSTRSFSPCHANTHTHTHTMKKTLCLCWAHGCMWKRYQQLILVLDLPWSIDCLCFDLTWSKRCLTVFWYGAVTCVAPVIGHLINCVQRSITKRERERSPVMHSLPVCIENTIWIFCVCNLYGVYQFMFIYYCTICWFKLQ